MTDRVSCRGQRWTTGREPFSFAFRGSQSRNELTYTKIQATKDAAAAIIVKRKNCINYCDTQ
uniref:Uncharacterized protein n=1 Tax=Romanomermis culicivorax TaxID=13658 RepID=A0A915JET0_ROMCU